jgi:predicted PurR-regulated permease PerM
MNFPAPTPEQARVIWLAVTALAGAVIMAILAGILWGFGQVLRLLSPVLWPLAVAGVFAYLLDPVVDVIERRGAPRARAIICVFALAAVIVLALFGSVVPQVLRETRQLAEKIPIYASSVENKVQSWIENPPKILAKFLKLQPDPGSGTNAAPATSSTAISTNGPPAPDSSVSTPSSWSTKIDAKTLQSATAWLAKVLPKVGAWLFGQVAKVASWFGVLAGMALIPVYAFYFLLEKEGIETKWTDYLPVAKSGFKDELVFVLQSINDYLIAFFRGQVIVALCDGVLYTIGFFIVGLPYAFLLGALATVLTMIPFLGAITTCVLALVIALVQFGDWLHPLLVLAVFAVVQTLEGLVISPKIMGDRVGLHPLSIIIAVMVGTTLLGGLLGGILAIPLTAALRVVMFRYVWKKREP